MTYDHMLNVCLMQVEQFRAEAQAASAALHAAVERTSNRVLLEEAQVDRLRSDTTQQVRLCVLCACPHSCVLMFVVNRLC